MENKNLFDYIGNTPLIKASTLLEKDGISLYFKLEGNNPTGSIKDRASYNMIHEAIKGGKIKKGDQLTIDLKSVPGKPYKGKITFIDPFINPKTRVAYVRVELPNNKGLLKPDMFANGIITSKLPIKEDVILIPKSAVLWTGKRGVVYVKSPEREHNSFIYREVVLGEDAGDFYVIKKGLEEGEEIATNGVFKIDAAAQLAGKKSMMNVSDEEIDHSLDDSESTKAEFMVYGNGNNMLFLWKPNVRLHTM